MWTSVSPWLKADLEDGSPNPAASKALIAAWKGPKSKTNPTGLRARLRTVKSGDELDLGGGRVLSFTLAPTPRWPDTVVTFDRTSGQGLTLVHSSAHPKPFLTQKHTPNTPYHPLTPRKTPVRPPDNP